MSQESVSSTGLSGIVGEEYARAQQEIEEILLRNINQVTKNPDWKIERISEISDLVSRLLERADTSERKLRITNEKLVALELAGVAVPGTEMSSARILHADIQRKDAQISLLLEERDNAAIEIERLTSLMESSNRTEQTTINRLASDLASAESEKEVLASELQGKNKRICELELMLEEVRIEMHEVKHDLLTRSSETLDSRRSLEAENEKLRKVITDLEAQVKTVKREHISVQKRLESELDRLRTEMNNKSSLIDQRDHLIRSLNAKTAGAIAHVQDKIDMSNLQDECARQRRRRVELESELKSRRGEIELLGVRLKEQELSADRMAMSKNETIRQLELQNREILKKLAESELVVRAMDPGRLELTLSVEKLEGDFIALQQVLDAVRTQYETVKHEKDQIEKELKEALNVIAESDRKIDVELRAVSVDLETMQRRSTDAITEAAYLRDQLAAFQEQYNAVVSEMQSMERQMKSLTDERSAVQGKDELIRTLQEEVTVSKEKYNAVVPRMQSMEQQMKSLTDERSALRGKDELIRTLQEQLTISEFHRGAFETELRALQQHVSQLKEIHIEKLPLNEHIVGDDVIVTDAVLVDDDGYAQEEIDIASAELRSLIETAGWPMDNGDDLGSLVSVVRGNMQAFMEFYGNQLREAELDVEYLRSELETRKMMIEDLSCSCQVELMKTARAVEDETGKRKVIQESALELAEKTTEFWNKYRSKQLPQPFPTLPN
jgi:chromosome segregation ATPase